MGESDKERKNTLPSLPVSSDGSAWLSLICSFAYLLLKRSSCVLWLANCSVARLFLASELFDGLAFRIRGLFEPFGLIGGLCGSLLLISSSLCGLKNSWISSLDMSLCRGTAFRLPFKERSSWPSERCSAFLLPRRVSISNPFVRLGPLAAISAPPELNTLGCRNGSSSDDLDGWLRIDNWFITWLWALLPCNCSGEIERKDFIGKLFEINCLE